VEGSRGRGRERLGRVPVETGTVGGASVVFWKMAVGIFELCHVGGESKAVQSLRHRRVGEPVGIGCGRSVGGRLGRSEKGTRRLEIWTGNEGWGRGGWGAVLACWGS